MLAQQILNGLVTGSIYALFALGFTLVFGVHGILNLAHGAVFTAGAFLAYFSVAAGWPLWAAVSVAMIGGGLIAWLVDLVAFLPLRKRRELEFSALISSLGASLCLTSVAQRLSETQILRFPAGTFPIEIYRFWGLRISLLQITVILLVCVLVSALMFCLYRTSIGRQIRAVSANERMAMLLGASPRSIYFQTFFVSGALAGLAGVLIGLSFNSIHFLMGEPYLLLAFVVVVLGGLGSVHGAVVAGLLLGVLQALSVAYLPSGLSDAIIFSLLFVLLLVKPSGLFGRAALRSGAMRQ